VSPLLYSWCAIIYLMIACALADLVHEPDEDAFKFYKSRPQWLAPLWLITVVALAWPIFVVLGLVFAVYIAINRRLSK
jgi:uncharacterized membrane protein